MHKKNQKAACDPCSGEAGHFVTLNKGLQLLPPHSLHSTFTHPVVPGTPVACGPYSGSFSPGPLDWQQGTKVFIFIFFSKDSLSETRPWVNTMKTSIAWAATHQSCYRFIFTCFLIASPIFIHTRQPIDREFHRHGFLATRPSPMSAGKRGGRGCGRTEIALSRYVLGKHYNDSMAPVRWISLLFQAGHV